MSYELPINEICAVANEALWEVFTDAYREKYRCPPSSTMWSEEAVVQWFDRFMYTDKTVDFAD